ncbi:MAG: class I SAM-dependent methyltransferase [Pseudomonadota bacterium]
MSWAEGREGAHEVVSETDRHGRPLRTVLDTDTGLVRNDPIPNDAELARFYSEDYRTSYKGAATPRKRQILRNFRRVAEHVRTFRDVLGQADQVLDVGAGSGEFAFLMGQLGKTVTGIEPNAGYAEYCRNALGLDVRTAHLDRALFEEGQFDLIRLNHVLEHLNDPVRYLAMMRDWLKPDGVLYVEVPNIETYAREKSRGNMFHYGHIFNFNPWTLRTAAGLAGLEECAETAERSRDTTGVFFRWGPVLPVAQATNRENAAHVRDMVAGHYAGAFRKGKATKPITKLAARIEETMTGLAAGTPEAIGLRVARTLQEPGHDTPGATRGTGPSGEGHR